MKNIKHQMIIDTLLKLAVIIALIVAVTTKQHYSYYNFLRWLITAAYTNVIARRRHDDEAISPIKLIKLYNPSPAESHFSMHSLNITHKFIAEIDSDGIYRTHFYK